MTKFLWDLFLVACAGLIGIAIAATFANEKPRFEFEEPLQPVPMDPAELPPAGGPLVADQEPAESPPEPEEDLRPVVLFYAKPGCREANVVRRAIARGEFVGLNVIEKPPPDWVDLCPTFHWPKPDGQWVIYPVTAQQYAGVSGLLKSFDYACPGARLKAVSASGVAVASSATEIVARFLPAGTVITVQTPTPVKARLEDGTIVSYQTIRGKVTHQNGIPAVAFDPPFPTVSAWKGWGPIGLRLGAQIQGAQYEDTSPPAVGINTNHGKFRMELKPAQ